MISSLVVLVRARNPVLLSAREPRARVVRTIIDLVLCVRNLDPEANLAPLLILARPARARLPRLLHAEAARDVRGTACEVGADGEGLVFAGLDGACVGVAAADFAGDLLPEPPVFRGTVAYEAGLWRPLGARAAGLAFVEGVQGHFGVGLCVEGWGCRYCSCEEEKRVGDGGEVHVEIEELQKEDGVDS